MRPVGVETIKGTVSRVVFSSEETGYKVLQVRTPTGSPTIVTGEFGPEIIPGTAANFHGSFKTHAKYGTQFRVTSVDITFNAEEQASIRLFIDNIAPQIGKERSSAITQHFRGDTIRILDEEPERLQEVPGIGKVSAHSLMEAWKLNRERWNKEREIYSLRAFLYSLGLKEKRVKRVLATFGGGLEAEEKIRQNPYSLTKVQGFGFTTVDFIAKQLGVPDSSPNRFSAFIQYLIYEICPSNGHLYLTAEEVLALATKYCQENSTTFLEKKQLLLEDVNTTVGDLTDGEVVQVDQNCIYSPSNLMIEKGAAATLVRIMSTPSDLIFLNQQAVNEYIQWFELDTGMTLSEEQRQALHYFLDKKVFIITGGPGTGKCLGKDTPVMLFDGSIKKVQDVVTGDFLMGDDSTPRRVSNTCLGREELYRVTPVKGDAYVVNKSHILSLKESGGTRNVPKGTVTDISIEDYFKLTAKRRHHLKGYRVPVTFTERVVPVDPYILGFWIGNGDSSGPRISTPFKEVIDHVNRVVSPWGMSVKKVAGDNVDYGVTCDRGSAYYENLDDKRYPNMLTDALRELNLIENKHIPNIYKFNNEKIRLGILAGLIDSEGHYSCNGYDIIMKSKEIIDDIVFIARSLGFSAYAKPCKKKWDCIAKGKHYSGEGNYFRISINGEIDRIPVVVKKKIATPRAQKKSVLVTGIRVRPIGVGDYYGFELEGNGRFLLGDFTVTHNTTLLKAIVGLAQKMHLNLTCMTPTGISAKKLALTVGYEAFTIHRRLGYRGNAWVHNENNPYETDLAIIDEASMLDQEVLYRFLIALKPSTHIIFVGDQDQLPSVSAGNVLRELIGCGDVPTVKLEKIFRQDEASDIIKVAHRIRHGDSDLSLFKDDPKADVFFLRMKDIGEIEIFVVNLARKFKAERRSFQIITPRNDGPIGVEPLNKALQEALNPESQEPEQMNLGKFILRRGDRVIVRKNDYELDVFNGDIGKVIAIGGGRISIMIDEHIVEFMAEEAEEKLRLAYAITCHKSQGLEYPFIILPFINQFGRNMLQRNLLYTAITRAKEKVIVIGHGSALERAINNASVSRRNTRLGERISECLQKRGISTLQSLGPQVDSQIVYNKKEQLSSSGIELQPMDAIES